MRLLRICLSLLLATTCFGQAGNVNLKPLPGMQFVNRTHQLGRGLVGLWLFNERSGNKVFDLSGNGNTGTLVGNAYFGAGKFGPTLFFDGDDDWVGIADNLSLNLDTTFTLSVWAKRVDLANVDGIYQSGGQANAWNLAILADDRIDFFEDAVADYVFDSTITDTNWHHIVVVKDGDSGTNLRFYLDGKPDGTDSCGTVTTPSGAKYIGKESSANHEMNGGIDLPMLYNRALSASEIALLYREPFCMFERDDIALIATAAAPPSVVPTPYYYRGEITIPFIFSVLFSVSLYVNIRTRSHKCAA